MLNCVGKLWTRSQKLAYTLLNKLSTRNEPLLVPGDRVSRPRSKMHCNLLQTLLTRSRPHFSDTMFRFLGFGFGFLVHESIRRKDGHT